LIIVLEQIPRTYPTRLFFFVLQFLLLSLSFRFIRKNCTNYKIPWLNIEKRKYVLCVIEEKSQDVSRIRKALI